jgi:hypothetical protein
MKNNYFLAFLSAFLLWLAWPPIPYTSILLFVGFVPLLIAVENVIRGDFKKKGRKIFGLAFLTGSGLEYGIDLLGLQCHACLFRCLHIIDDRVDSIYFGPSVDGISFPTLLSDEEEKQYSAKFYGSYLILDSL